MVLSSRTDPRRNASRSANGRTRRRRELEDGHRSIDVDDRHTGDVSDPAGVRGRTGGPDATTRRCRVRPRCRRSSTLPPATTRPEERTTEVVADPLDEVELVRGEEDRHAAGGLLAHEVGHRVDGVRVEAGERLVEDQRDRRRHHRRGDLDALLVAERERLEGVVRRGRPGRTAPGTRGPTVAPPGRSSRAAGRGRPAGTGPAASGTGRAPRACSRTGRGRRDRRAAAPPHLARGGFEDAHDHPHRRRLAGAVPADEPGEASGPHREVHRVHGPDVSEQPGQSPGLEHASTLGRRRPGRISPQAEVCCPPRDG